MEVSEKPFVLMLVNASEMLSSDLMHAPFYHKRLYIFKFIFKRFSLIAGFLMRFANMTDYW